MSRPGGATLGRCAGTAPDRAVPHELPALGVEQEQQSLLQERPKRSK